MFSSCVCYFYFSCKRKNVSHLISPFLKRVFNLERVMFSQREGKKKLEGKIQKGNKFIVLFCFTFRDCTALNPMCSECPGNLR